MKSTHPVRMSKSPVFLLAVASLIVWWSALFGLAFWTSNPPTLNLRQLKQAQYLVSARIVKRDPDTILVEKEWKKNKDWKELQVSNLPQNVPSNELLLIPISPRNGEEGWEVTRAILIVELEIIQGQIIPFDGTVMRGRGVITNKTGTSENAIEKGAYLKEGQVMKSGAIILAKFSPPMIYPATEEVISGMQELLGLADSK